MQFSKFKAMLCLIITFSFISPLFAADKFKVITTFTVVADLARNVAGDAAIVESITKPGAEIHNYQPTPRDILKALDADLVLYNGMNLESWFEKFLSNFDGVPTVILTQGIEPIGIYEGPYAGKPNPHAWMSPSDALIYIENIRAALIKYDPKNTQTYNTNAKQYSQQVKAIAQPIKQALMQIPEDRRWLVTSEGAFSYLIRDFGLKELYLWPINADQQGTPQQVRHVIDEIRAKNIAVIFSESTIPADAAKQVARETGAKYGGILYVDSLSKADGPVPTYLDLIRVTSQVIIDGLSL